SSRRRHTRWPRDWSSDVCSSDLEMSHGWNTDVESREMAEAQWSRNLVSAAIGPITGLGTSSIRVSSVFIRGSTAWIHWAKQHGRSEERRVGKECRSGRWQDQNKK